jgi:hypothetical protein
MGDGIEQGLVFCLLTYVVSGQELNEAVKSALKCNSKWSGLAFQRHTKRFVGTNPFFDFVQFSFLT